MLLGAGTASVGGCGTAESCLSPGLAVCWFGEGFLMPDGKQVSSMLQRTYGLSFPSPLAGQIVLKYLHS